MNDIINETSKIFDWYKGELQNLAKLINGSVDHRKIFIEFKDFFTQENTGLKYIKIQVPPVIRFKNVGGESAEMIKKFGIQYRIDMSEVYWVNQAKRDKMRTFEYFYKILKKQQEDKISDIRVKYGVIIPLKYFEEC